MDDHWSVWLSGNYYDYPSYSSPFVDEERWQSSQFYESSFSVRYTLSQFVLSPYFLTGAGILYEYPEFIPSVYNNDENLPPQSTSLKLEEGFGIQVPIKKGMNFFSEVKMNIIFQPLQSSIFGWPNVISNITAIDYPIDVGIVLTL